MKQVIDENGKILELWLTADEHDSPAFMASLKPLYAQCRKDGYRCVVFCSGSRDLASLTAGLLRHNSTTAARRDLAQKAHADLAMAI